MNRGMKRRHQQRRGSSLARNIAERNHQTSIFTLDEVVIVAADFVTGETDALQFVTLDVWRRSRLKTLLDLAGQCEFSFKSLAFETRFDQTGIFNAYGSDGGECRQDF